MKFINLTVVSVVLAAFVLQGCRTESSDPQLEEALALAGSNRGQLEAVLDHYAGDSIGLEAAKFLIRNMPGHYSYADTLTVDRFYDSLDSLTAAMKGQPLKDIQSAIKQLCEEHRAGFFPTIEDVRIIRADFLIDNIDGALRQWRELPWCEWLSFEQFCEYILPYKTTELQELRPWRERYRNFYEDSLARIASCSIYRVSAFQAAETLNNSLKQHFSKDPYDYEIPRLYYRPLSRLAIPFATCDDICNTAPQAFRAAGIPVVLDNVPVWGYGNRGHSWLVVHAPTGNDIPFVPIDGSLYQTHKLSETAGKAYRRTYARNPEIVELNASQSEVPELFRDVFQRDVTSLYADTRDLTIDVDAGDGDYVYLCSSSRATWRPVAFAKVEEGKAKFKDVGKGCIYLIARYRNGEVVPLDNPFMIERDGDYRPIVADHDRLTSATLYRKAPLLEYAWRAAIRSENGVFEAADNPAFINAVTVGSVDEPADRAGEISVDTQEGAHRYWRYIGRGDEAVCCIGEISMLQGDSIINSRGRAYSNCLNDNKSDLTDCRRAFDGDVLTAVTFTQPREAWVAIDFGRPEKIDKIRYSPRSDGNMVEPGDEYELVCWSAGDWQSLGRKTATTVSISFDNIPADGIYILHNRTKGSSVRIFRIDRQGNQEWW